MYHATLPLLILYLTSHSLSLPIINSLDAPLSLDPHSATNSPESTAAQLLDAPYSALSASRNASFFSNDVVIFGTTTKHVVATTTHKHKSTQKTHTSTHKKHATSTTKYHSKHSTSTHKHTSTSRPSSSLSHRLTASTTATTTRARSSPTALLIPSVPSSSHTPIRDHEFTSPSTISHAKLALIISLCLLLPLLCLVFILGWTYIHQRKEKLRLPSSSPTPSARDITPPDFSALFVNDLASHQPNYLTTVLEESASNSTNASSKQEAADKSIASTSRIPPENLLSRIPTPPRELTPQEGPGDQDLSSLAFVASLLSPYPTSTSTPNPTLLSPYPHYNNALLLPHANDLFPRSPSMVEGNGSRVVSATTSRINRDSFSWPQRRSKEMSGSGSGSESSSANSSAERVEVAAPPAGSTVVGESRQIVVDETVEEDISISMSTLIAGFSLEDTQSAREEPVSPPPPYKTQSPRSQSTPTPNSASALNELSIALGLSPSPSPPSTPSEEHERPQETETTSTLYFSVSGTVQSSSGADNNSGEDSMESSLERQHSTPRPREQVSEKGGKAKVEQARTHAPSNALYDVILNLKRSLSLGSPITKTRSPHAIAERLPPLSHPEAQLDEKDAMVFCIPTLSYLNSPATPSPSPSLPSQPPSTSSSTRTSPERRKTWENDASINLANMIKSLDKCNETEFFSALLDVAATDRVVNTEEDEDDEETPTTILPLSFCNPLDITSLPLKGENKEAESNQTSPSLDVPEMLGGGFSSLALESLAGITGDLHLLVPALADEEDEDEKKDLSDPDAFHDAVEHALKSISDLSEGLPAEDWIDDYPGVDDDYPYPLYDIGDTPRLVPRPGEVARRALENEGRELFDQELIEHLDRRHRGISVNGSPLKFAPWQSSPLRQRRSPSASPQTSPRLASPRINRSHSGASSVYSQNSSSDDSHRMILENLSLQLRNFG